VFFSNCSLDTVLSCGLSTNQHNVFPLPFFLCLRSSFRKSQPGSLAQTVIENIAHDKFLAFSGSTFVVRRRALTIFLCHYLRSEALRHEINARLNVIENWNGANSFNFYGKSGDFATNRLDGVK